MFTFSQSTGIFQGFGLYCFCISGHGEGENNPAMQEAECVGPLPRGLYLVGQAHNNPKLGPNCFTLTPSPGNEMFGRSDFLIHALRIGTTMQAPDTSSDGCICMDHDDRAKLAPLVLADATLEVML